MPIFRGSDRSRAPGATRCRRGRGPGKRAGRAGLLVFVLLLLPLSLLTACGDGEGDAGDQAAVTATDGNGTEVTGPATEGDQAGGGAGDEDPENLVLMTHDSFALSEGTLTSFEEQTGIHVQVLQAGDAGAMLNQAILTKDNPVADVIFGVDNTFLSRALEADLFVPYESELLDAVPENLRLDPENRVTPVDFGYISLNYDKSALGGQGQAPVPEQLADLPSPEYRAMLVVENPATSSPGLAFLLATIAEFGEEGDYTWQDYWAELEANDLLVAGGWEEAYYSHFTAAGGGDRPLVVSYASSPAAEVIFAEQELEEAPTGVMTDGSFRQIEFAGILSGTEKERAAREFIDFMLSLEFQEDIPLNMFVFPANENAELPPEFVQYAALPPESLTLDIVDIEANREKWIEEWAGIVLD